MNEKEVVDPVAYEYNKDGATMESVAAVFGVTQTTIRAYIKRNGIPKKKRTRPEGAGRKAWSPPADWKME